MARMRQSSARSGSATPAASPLLPTSLPVSRPDDASERQAAAITGHRGTEPSPHFSFATVNVYPPIRGNGNDDPLRSKLEQLQGGGSPLPRDVRSGMETRFGHDFGDVRIHADDEAATLSDALQAEAFTFGRDIYVGTPGFDPAGGGGGLLAHELAHTLQQRSGGLQIQRSCHKVASKETLTAISKIYGVSVEALAEANDLTASAILPIGTLLVIPDGKPCKHTVSTNDTLYSISQTYNASVDEIKTANKLTSDVIKPGDVLEIPITDSSAYELYTVVLKDTLFALATAKGVTVDEIKALNGLKNDNLAEGQELKIPKAKPAAATAAKTPAATGVPSTTAPIKPAPTSPSVAAPVKPAPTTVTQPPTTTPVTTPAPAKTAAPVVAASSSSDPGHNPGKDYASGTMRERSVLRAADKTTHLLSGKDELFFESGAAVKLLSASGNWVEVEGEAWTNAAKPAKAGKQKGWIQRDWTSMTLGDYKDLPVEDLTKTYGKLSSGSLAKTAVNNVILHQTGSPTGAPTLADYKGRIKKGSTIGAHYLIDETGSVKLVVPVNQKVSHVGKTKPGFKDAGNPNAIGIEHAGKPLKLDLPTADTDKTTIDANRAAIKAFAMAPELKARIVGMSDKELYALARANSDKKAGKWFVYGDLNAKQKRSSHLLTTRLRADFNLDEDALQAHETVSWKTVGEGENIKEFLTARDAYPGQVTALAAAVKGDTKLSADSSLATLVTFEKETVDALAKDATEAENKDLTAEKAAKPGAASKREDLRVKFYDKFWSRVAQLTALIAFLATSGATKPDDLKKMIAAWVK